MLTRRENLLIRPWQERRYINHRIKVENALPAIDNNPPAYRQHVICKMKKYQKEKERCSQIVSDNFTLLQHLAYITRTTRVDNTWEEPPPNFLNRVGIYSCRRKSYFSEGDEPGEHQEDPKTRKERCYGCSPNRYIRKICIPEERVPFPPPKKRVSRKLQSPTVSEVRPIRKTKSANDSKQRAEEKESHAGREKQRRSRMKQRKLVKETQSLLLSRGCITLKLRFPADSDLLFNDRGNEKVIQQKYCHCAAPYAIKNSE